MPPLLSLVGKKFGRLTVVGPHRIESKRTYWRCLCACGKETWVSVGHLRSGDTKSCGCLNDDMRSARKTTHGYSKTKLYKTWIRMRVRCNNVNSKDYYRYGGRGIGICKEWNDFVAFREWSLGNGYNESLSIDRIDNDGNYEPSNCRWITSTRNAARTARSFTFEDAQSIRLLRRMKFFKQVEIAELFGTIPTVVSSIVNFKSYREPLENM